MTQKPRQTNEQFIEKATKIHGERYDYSRVIFQRVSTKVEIVCQAHGSFWQLPFAHLKGQGCPGCYPFNKRKTNESFIEEARKIHGDRYDYSKTVYVNQTGKVIIGCPVHGDFHQAAGNHINTSRNGSGCPKCSSRSLMTTSEFSERASKVHDNRYGYTSSVYTGIMNHLIVTCPIHGDFRQTPDVHLRGHGCPVCNLSKGQKQVCEFIKQTGLSYILNERTKLDGIEIDIWIPEKNLGIEFHGLAFHVENPVMGSPKKRSYHYEKFERAQQAGIDLIQIVDDEWRDRNDVCKKTLHHRLGLTPSGKSARQLRIGRVSSVQARDFLEKHHLQGASRGYFFGAFDDGTLVAVLGMSRPTRKSKHDWELRRFATDEKRHPGVFSRLFKLAQTELTPVSVVTFADLRWFTGSSYTHAGFVYDGLIAPDYTYVDMTKTKKLTRMHKSNFRKDRLPGIGTERERTRKLNLERFYDAGKYRWVWKR